MEKKFLLSGPFADELMTEVENNVLKRGYTPEELLYKSIPVEYDIINDFILNFDVLNDLTNINLYDRIQGKGLKPFIKKCLMKIFGWFVIPAFEEQITINKMFFSIFEQTYNELLIVKEKINNLKNQ